MEHILLSLSYQNISVIFGARGELKGEIEFFNTYYCLLIFEQNNGLLKHILCDLHWDLFS